MRREKIRRPSGTWITPLSTIDHGVARVMSCPKALMLPAWERTTPEMVETVVDLPAPLLPRRETISPPPTVRLRPESACTLP